jgi:hypothetical protein
MLISEEKNKLKKIWKIERKWGTLYIDEIKPQNRKFRVEGGDPMEIHGEKSSRRMALCGLISRTGPSRSHILFFVKKK